MKITCIALLLTCVFPIWGNVKSENCEGVSKTIRQAFTSTSDPSKNWSRTIVLPATGRFTIEAHYVTISDTFKDGYPKIKNESIQRHLIRSLSFYKAFDSSATCTSLYSYNDEWTPMEHGKYGQGSIGDRQNELLDPSDELWLMNMMWAKGNRPAVNSKFLLSYKGRSVVVIAGYETGPSNKKFIGGITGEVHSWLKTTVNSDITVSYLKDQTIKAGPCNCQ